LEEIIDSRLKICHDNVTQPIKKDHQKRLKPAPRAGKIFSKRVL